MKKGWRTMTFNVASGVVAAGTGLLEYIGVIDLPQGVIIGAVIAVNIANGYLRVITTTAVGQQR